MTKIIKFPSYTKAYSKLGYIKTTENTIEELIELITLLFEEDLVAYTFFLANYLGEEPVELTPEVKFKLRSIGLIDKNGHSPEAVRLIMREIVNAYLNSYNTDKNEPSDLSSQLGMEKTKAVSFHDENMLYDDILLDINQMKGGKPIQKSKDHIKTEYDYSFMFDHREDDNVYGPYKTHVFYDSEDYTVEFVIPMINRKEAMDLAHIIAQPKTREPDMDYYIFAGVNSTKASKEEFEITSPSVSFFYPEQHTINYVEINGDISEEYRKAKRFIKKLDVFVRTEFPGYAILWKRKDRHDISYSWYKYYSQWYRTVTSLGLEST